MKRKTTLLLAKLMFLPAAIAATLTLSGCGNPAINSFDVGSGPEHTLVMINGDTLFARIIWDAGLASETVLPGGFLGGYMFSVPPGASSGNHPVALDRSGNRSAVVNFNVTPAQPFGAPRIDGVMLAGTSFGGGNVDTWLVVQGANLDVGSVVQVGGVDKASVAYKGLRNDLFGIAPTALSYPIYHYVSVLAQAPGNTAGSALTINVRNLDGQVSAPFTYTLPANAAALDSDGDGLLDSWETSGFDGDGDGTIDVDLKALGAENGRRDILMEIDTMTGLTNAPIATAGGTPGTFDTMKNIFASAPILGFGRNNGINLIMDTSGTVPFSTNVSLTAPDSAMTSTANFYTLKAANFDNARRGAIYHYVIWGNMQPGGFSGISDIAFAAEDANGVATGSGDDFIVSFDDFSASFQTLRSQVETLMHEFGHNLGQRHGGSNHNQFKPNYWSVMAYTWQLRTGQSNATRRARVTCPPFYYAASGAAEPNGALPGAINAITDYSEGMANSLVENNNSLNETTGVCGLAVDWNGDGDQTDVNINADADDSGSSTDTVTDFANWRALNYRGPANNGQFGS
jgi:hypothetical protein